MPPITDDGNNVVGAKTCCRVMIKTIERYCLENSTSINKEIHLVNMCPTITQWLREECEKK